MIKSIKIFDKASIETTKEDTTLAKELYKLENKEKSLKI